MSDEDEIKEGDLLVDPTDLLVVTVIRFSDAGRHIARVCVAADSSKEWWAATNTLWSRKDALNRMTSLEHRISLVREAFGWRVGDT